MSAFVDLLGPTLHSKSGPQPTAEALRGKVVALYYSAHWCPPCRQFTPELAQYYRLVKDALEKPFEIVFVSSDRDEASFNEYYAEHPWLALPFADRDRKAVLSTKFKVQGIPTLIFLDENAKVITKNGREKVSDDPDGEGWPYHPVPLRTLLGTTFVDKTGQETSLAALFTPMLAKIYGSRKADQKDDFEVIFVSLDREEQSWKSYMEGHHPWLAVPYSDQSRIKALASHFDVSGIPCLIMLNPELKVINTDTVSSVHSDPTGTSFPWPPKPIADFSESTSSGGHSIGDKPAFIAFVEQCDDAEQGEVMAALLTVALEYQASGETNEDGPDVIFFTNVGVSRIGDKIRGDTTLGPVASASGPQFLLLDISERSYYEWTKGEEVGADAMREYLQDYKDGKLVKKALGEK